MPHFLLLSDGQRVGFAYRAGGSIVTMQSAPL
jgi:hypothetical protein